MQIIMAGRWPYKDQMVDNSKLEAKMKRKSFSTIISIVVFLVAGFAWGSSETTNLKLTKPGKGDRNWGQTINDNMDKLDTGYGTMVTISDDLPEVYIYTNTFNGSTGRQISLPKSVDAINEYDVKITPTSRGAAIGDIYVTKTTSNFTVKCSENNTTDTFTASVYYIGDVTSYGGSIYRRWYVSPDSSITDHANASTTGSIAWVQAQIGSSPAIIETPSNKTYQIKNNLTLNDNILYQPQMGAIIDTDFSIRDSNYQWDLSGSGTSEYYLQASGGGNPNVNQPAVAIEDNAQMIEGNAGNLAAGEWDWNDNDSLGYATVYVRLSDSTDPDSKAVDYVEARYILSVNGEGSADWCASIDQLMPSGLDVINLSPNTTYTTYGDLGPAINCLIRGPKSAKIILADSANRAIFNISSSGVTIEGFEIDGNRANQNHTSENYLIKSTGDDIVIKDTYLHAGDYIGIYTSDANRVRVEKCRIVDVRYYGAVLEATTGDVTDLKFINNTIDRNVEGVGIYGGGIMIHGTALGNLKNFVCQGNYIYLPTSPTSERECIAFAYAKHGAINGNVTSGGTMGISGGDASTHITITDNEIYNGDKYGIEAVGNYFTIADNVIDNGGIGEWGIDSTVEVCSITGNLIRNLEDISNAVGISLGNGYHHVTVSGNIILSPNGQSINVPSGTATKIAITGNILERYMLCAGLEHSTITGNTFLCATGIGLEVTAKGTGLTINGNTFCNASSAAIRWGGTAAVDDISITGNLFSDCTKGFEFYMTGAGAIGNNSIIANNIGNNHYKTETVAAPTLVHWAPTKLDSSSNAINATLGDGTYVGQIATIVMSDSSNSSTVSITHHETSDPEVATFDEVDETGMFMWTGTEWTTIKATCTFL